MEFLEEIFEWLLVLLVYFPVTIYVFFLIRDLFRYKWYKAWRFWVLCIFYVLSIPLIQVVMMGVEYDGNGDFFSYLISFGIPMTIPIFHYWFYQKKTID